MIKVHFKIRVLLFVETEIELHTWYRKYQGIRSSILLCSVHYRDNKSGARIESYENYAGLQGPSVITRSHYNLSRSSRALRTAGCISAFAKDRPNVIQYSTLFSLAWSKEEKSYTT
jgi:hypothetical protein